MSLYRRANSLVLWFKSSLLGQRLATVEDRSLQHENNSAVPPAAEPREKPWSLAWLIVLMLPVFVALCLIVPPFDDELYYWCWSQELQFSYYDHPPMTAYMIRLATMVFGKSILAIRVPCIISALIVFGVVTYLSRPRNLIPYVFLSPVPTFAAVMITPDVPLLMFWALYLLWLVSIHQRLAASPDACRKDLEGIRGESTPHAPREDISRSEMSTFLKASHPPRWWHWVLGGVIIGCGVLGKYTTGLAVIAGFFTFVFAGNWRRWIVGYTVHGLVAFLVASPILIHNIIYDFAPIRYQWGHSMSSPEPGLSSFMEFVGIQALLFGTIPFVVFVWGSLRIRSFLVDPRLRVCACLFLIPFAFFLFKATRGRLEGNWAFPCFLACWPMAAELYRRVKHLRWCRILAGLGFAVPIGASVFFTIHAIVPIPGTPIEHDRPTRQWDKMALMRVMAAELGATGYTGPVYASTYQWVSVLRWHGLDGRQLEGFSRTSHFTEHPNPPIDPKHYVVFMETATENPVEEFSRLGKYRVICTHRFVVRDVPLTFFHLVDYSDPPIVTKGSQLP